MQDFSPLLLSVSYAFLNLLFFVVLEVLRTQTLALTPELLDLRVSFRLGAPNGLERREGKSSRIYTGRALLTQINVLTSL